MFHFAMIRAAAMFKKFTEEENYKGHAGVFATFGANKRGKKILQKIEIDPAIYSAEQAKVILAGLGLSKAKFSKGMTIPSEFDFVSESGDLEILAAEKADGEEKEPLRNFRMLAYTGKPMLTSGIPTPLIVDLNGLDLQLGKKLPILVDHKTTQRAGHSDKRVIKDNEIHVSGVLSAATKFTKEITESSDNGYPWQSSIGAKILKARFISKKTTEVVNGQKVSGPMLVVDKAILREVSFVSIGADDDTSAVAASSGKKEEIDMKFAAWLKAKGFDEESLKDEVLTNLKAMWEDEGNTDEGDEPEPKKEVEASADDGEVIGDAIKAERKRGADIAVACGKEFPEIQAEATAGGWDLAKTESKILAAIREKRVNVNTGLGSPEGGSMEVVEAALSLRCGISHKDLENDFSKEVVAEADKDRGMSLRDVMAAVMHSEGVSVPRSMGNDFIRAAISTVSLPGILSNVANKRMLKAYQLQNITATKLCSEGDLADFKVANRYRLNELGGFDPLGATGEIKHGTLGEEKATNQLTTYGKMITLGREMIINDDLSALTKIPAAIAARAAQKIDELFYTRLLSNPTFTDNVALFIAAHKNYQSGTATALSVDSINAAMQLFMNQTDIEGKPINVIPTKLVVPTSLLFTAKQLLTSSTLQAVGDTDARNIGTANPLTGAGLEVVASPWLNAQSLTNSSALGWYLMGDSSVVDTFEIGYLRGARTPTLEQVALPSDQLGMGWRAYFDLGIREQDFRGMVFSKGEA